MSITDATRATRRPNFLVFVTDQHRADHLGCYGNPVVRTPHIDALAAQGTRFTRCYVANPVCMPNRGSMMTGRMSSAHGARGNGVALPLEAVTFGDVLSGIGYRTALVGKSHLQNMEDRPPLLPPRTETPGVQASVQYPEATRDDRHAARYQQERRSSWDDPAHHLTLPYYGFQDVVLCDNHADECWGDYARWLAREHPEMVGRIGREQAPRDPRFVAPQAWRTPLSEFQYPTHYIADQCSEWLRSHAARNADQPFMLMCSFPDPHHPWTPPGRYWDMYDPAAMPVPATALGGAEGRARHVAWLWDERAQGKANLDSPRMFATNPREIQEILALNYGMITNIDDRVALVMQTLRDTGLDRDTVVIFTADHGDFMGDHGLMLKGPLHYQGLIRVPFIWREPAGTASPDVREDLVSSIDLGPSLLRRAGIEAPNGTQGLGLFAPSGTSLPSQRRGVLVEEHQQRAYVGFDTPVLVRTLVTATHRLSMFQEGDWGELYDLVEDPLETRNLWGDPTHQGLQLRLVQQLVQLIIEHTDQSPRPTRMA